MSLRLVGHTDASRFQIKLKPVNEQEFFFVTFELSEEILVAALGFNPNVKNSTFFP